MFVNCHFDGALAATLITKCVINATIDLCVAVSAAIVVGAVAVAVSTVTVLKYLEY